MSHDDIGNLCSALSVFGGIALVIWSSVRAKISLLEAKARLRRQTESPTQDTAVLAELRALKRQVAEMNSTSHAFDISFDESLSRLAGRVDRLETKSAARVADTPAGAALQNGTSPAP